MNIARIFRKAAIKRLSGVETDPNISNQHEMNGVKGLLEIFGTPEGKQRFPTTFLYLSDTDEIDFPAEVQISSGNEYVTWYDAREKHPTRTEYRLYYSSGLFQQLAKEGDLLVVCFDGKQVWMMVAESGTDIENQLLWIFSDITPGILRKDRFTVGPVPERPEILSGIENMILERLGIETERKAGVDTEKMIYHFGGKFPTTREFSAYARSDTGIEFSLDDPDSILLEWWNREEILFRALEKHIVEERIATGFSDVDEFIKFSLSVHNRRKSRAGHAFENHLERIFLDHGLQYTRGGITEKRSKPDFVFPSIDLYRQAKQKTELIEFLTVLGAKTTCKDRWRQITREAELVEKKHLITLEPAISEEQTDEMKSLSVQLVVPEKIIPSYRESQRQWLMNISGFINSVREKQVKFSVNSSQRRR